MRKSFFLWFFLFFSSLLFSLENINLWVRYIEGHVFVFCPFLSCWEKEGMTQICIASGVLQIIIHNSWVKNGWNGKKKTFSTLRLTHRSVLVTWWFFLFFLHLNRVKVTFWVYTSYFVDSFFFIKFSNLIDILSSWNCFTLTPLTSLFLFRRIHANKSKMV